MPIFAVSPQKKFMPFSLLKSELRYCNPFRNPSMMNEGMLPNLVILRQKLVAMAMSLERSQSDIPGYQALLYLYQF